MIRRAAASEAPAIARLFRAVRTTCLPYLPDLHTPAEDLAFFRDHVFADCEVWVADPMAGFIAFRAGWVDLLYVDPARHRRGLGSALLAQAMRTHRKLGGRLRLWAFQRNAPALAFYAAHGFAQIERTDGQGNEEREPDVLLAWGEGR